MSEKKTTEKPATHTAWGIQRQRIRRWTITKPLECGGGHIDVHNGGIAKLNLDRLPLGFSGEVWLMPNGIKPGTKTEPQRPDDGSSADDGDSD